MTIERLNANEFKITNGNKAKSIHRQGMLCYVHEYAWNGDGWLVTFHDIYGMSIPACEAKYGIKF